MKKLIKGVSLSVYTLPRGRWLLKQIYTTEETGFCYRMLLGKTLAGKDIEHKTEDFKKIKDCMTIFS